MKKLLLAFCSLSIVVSAHAQVMTPQPSTSSKLEQTIGMTDVSVTYSRPRVKGRKIFGDLVPFGKMWRTGANKNTVFNFQHDVRIDGKPLKAGSYALYTVPSDGNWEFIFYSDSENWGLPKNWDDSKVALRFSKKVNNKLKSTVEAFSIVINVQSDDRAFVALSWENTFAGFTVKVPTDKLVQQSISSTLNSDGAKSKDYYAAAVYYLNAEKDIAKAEAWMDTAMSMTDNPKFWQLRQQSLIYAAAGKTKEAIKTAKKSLASAQKAGNADYVKLNEDSLKAWGAM